MGINAKLEDITVASTPTGGELIYIVQGGNSRQLALGAVGAGLIVDTGETGARTLVGLSGYSTIPGSSDVNLETGSGSFRTRTIAEDAPTNITVWEDFFASGSGLRSFGALSDDLSQRQNWLQITRTNKIYIDRDYVHSDDVAVSKTTLAAGGGTGGGYMTLEATTGDVPVNSRAIVGISGDPDATLVYSGETYGRSGVAGVTVSTVPNDWVEHNVGGNFDDLMNNYPSNARMIKEVAVMADLFRIGEKAAGNYIADRGILVGVIKDGQLNFEASERDNENKYLKNTDAGGIWLSVIDGKLILASRLNESSPQDVLFYTGNTIVGGWSGTNSNNWAIGGDTGNILNAQRPLHVERSDQILARFQSTSTAALIEMGETATTTRPAIKTDANDIMLRAGGNDVLKVKDGAAADLLSLDSNGVTISGGSSISKVLAFSASVDFASISAGSSNTQTITVTGAATGDKVFFSADMASSSLILAPAIVSAANTVQFRCHNISGGAINPAAKTFVGLVIGTV